jgi:type IV pilus assembly protein PilF
MNKLLMVGVLSISLMGCFGSNPPPKKDKHPHDVAEEAKIDLQKAALLNVEMGEAYLAQGQINRAKQKFFHALELKPKLPEAHSSMGYFYESVGDLEEAEYHYKQSISFSDHKGKFYNNYGTFLYRQGRYREADKAFNNAIKDKQYIKTAESYENAGMVALKQEKIDKAYEYFETALRRDPNLYKSSLELATLEVKKQNYQAAKNYLDHFKRIIDPTAKSLWLEIQVNKKLGNKKEVSVAVTKLKNQFPNSEEFKAYLESAKNG